MHLLVPFAADTSDDCGEALHGLALPHLERLLALLTPAGRDEGDASSLSPPHERALASAWGWQGGDGLLPFGAHAAGQDGVAVDAMAWALLTPSHWQLGRDDVRLLDPALLELAEPESRALFASAAELFASEGFAVAWGSTGRWYAARDDLDALPTASLDRVVGRTLERWLAAPERDSGVHATASLLRRLQSEAQIVFHDHEVNERREERGALTVNSFWLSGCGRPQAARAEATPEIDASLRTPLMAGDWAAWADAWRALDAGPIARVLGAARSGAPTTLTLCGERTAARFELQPRTLWQRLRPARAAAADVLAAL
jgi:hypothetical protein